jgi:hypothetical protein
MLRSLALVGSLVALLAVPVTARSQARPVYHGVLAARPAGGSFNQHGMASLRVRNWGLNLAPNSNGIAPDKEQIIIAIGDAEKLVVPVGTVRASKNHKRFTYRNPHQRGVRQLQIRRIKDDGDGTARYRISFSLVDVDLSFLLTNFPLCTSVAIIVGDDDGFEGLWFTLPGQFHSATVRVTGQTCETQDWPWI